MKWDDSVGPGDGTVVMWIKNLLTTRRGRRVQLHKMIAADKPDCFHTHPAFAIRVVLWNGYDEEVLVSGLDHVPSELMHTVRRIDGGEAYNWTYGWSYIRRIKPWHVGLVRPTMTHRITALPKGPNYSLWLRGRVHYPILLIGPGWPADMRARARIVQDENIE